MRTIDADALRDKFQNLAYDDWNQGVSTSWADAYNECADIVDDMPTVEPPRIRGRWIEDGYNDEKAVCDQCGEPCATYIMGEPRDKYCKWCGAEMRRTE